MDKKKKYIRWFLRVIILGIVFFPITVLIFFIAWFLDDDIEFKEFFDVYKFNF